MNGKQIRLSGTSYAVLSLIANLGEATPYELKNAMEQSIENFWPVPHTTFYAEPARLAAAGYLSEEQEQHGRRRKLYRLTERGEHALAAWAAAPEAAPPQVRDEGLLKIFAGADPEPILRARREWHVTKLTELEGMAVDQPWNIGELPGPMRTLSAGIGYHRMTIEAIDGFLAELGSAGSEPGPEEDGR